MKVFAYIRVSSKGQVEGDGPDRQRVAIKTFCDYHRLDCEKEYFDAGVSGTVDAMDRPAFTDMLKAIAEGEQKACIVVERIDRLARDLMVCEVLLCECRKRDIRVFSADQPDLTDLASDTTDPTRVLIRQMMAAFAEFEKSSLVRKLRDARIRKGKLGGNVFLGERVGEAEAVAAIKGMRKSGMTWTRIIDEMNASGIQRRNGKLWDDCSVRRACRAPTPSQKTETEKLNERLEECEDHIAHT